MAGSKTINLRLPSDLYDMVDSVASVLHVTIAQYVRDALELSIERLRADERFGVSVEQWVARKKRNFGIDCELGEIQITLEADSYFGNIEFDTSRVRAFNLKLSHDLYESIDTAARVFGLDLTTYIRSALAADIRQRQSDPQFEQAVTQMLEGKAAAFGVTLNLP